MPVKRKYSSTYVARKRSRFAFRRPRGRYGKTFRKKGLRFPAYKFHRYISTLGTYSASSNLAVSALPFTWYPDNLGAGAITNYPFSFSFALNDVANLTEFTSLFDRYMLTGVSVKFQLLSNPDVDVAQTAVAAVPSVQTYPRLWYAIDYDDSALTTLTQLKEYGNVKSIVLEPNKIKSIFVRAPRTAQSVSQTGGPVPAGINKPMWLDCGFPNVPHYGLKTCLDYGSVSPGRDTFAFRVKWEAVYYFRCKDVR